MTVEPFLFSSDAALLSALAGPDVPAGSRVAAVVVDWERRDKAERQARAAAHIGTDTQIGTDTPDDLARTSAGVRVPTICRLNAPGPHTAAEVDLAVRLGAAEVLVPMVRTEAEVEGVLRQAGERVGVGVMLETRDAVDRAARIGRLPICRAYVGLMDLALDRGSRVIFAALVDGTVERLRAAVAVPFGFGGLTVPGGGSPVPTTLLLGEMARLGCDFTFLRRSFIADTRRCDRADAVRRIRSAAAVAGGRSPAEREEDRRRLTDAVARLGAGVGAPA
jgi:hypothetical protein